jgi:HdeA/HdeB family protein
MRRGIKLAIAAVIASQAPGLTPSAWAVEYKFPCENFQKNEDGSWYVLKDTFIEGPQVYMRQENTIAPGRVVRGYDIAAIITEACPNAPVVPPAAAAAPGAAAPAGAVPGGAAPVPAQPPAVPLSRYADANGNIDVQRLTCGHLAAASADEANLLLAWYSGWYNGLAKGRGINLARLRYELHNVVDYCKANPDKRLVQVMELMLK